MVEQGKEGLTMRLIDADAPALIARINNSFGPVTRFIIKNILKNAPTIEAEPVRYGRWIDAYCGKYANAKYICSCCGKRAHSDDWKWELSDFCPHCGAKMDKEE